ncbi:MAG: TadE/TadG family type IV pilus assembly protein [Novosphingobium sp.]
MRLSTVWRAWAACRSGVAAVELAVALPLLVTLSMGGLELASFALANMRVNQIAISIADNASRAKMTSVSGAAQFREYDVSETFRAADLAYPAMAIFSNGRVVLSSLETNSSGGQWVHWQRCRGSKAVGSKYATQGTGSTGTSFAGMGPTGSIITAESGAAIMFAEVYYDYRPVTLPGATITIYRNAALYVRDDRDLSQIYNPSPTATVYSC